jgi:hypothetical protein
MLLLLGFAFITLRQHMLRCHWQQQYRPLGIRSQKCCCCCCAQADEGKPWYDWFWVKVRWLLLSSQNKPANNQSSDQQWQSSSTYSPSMHWHVSQVTGLKAYTCF